MEFGRGAIRLWGFKLHKLKKVCRDEFRVAKNADDLWGERDPAPKWINHARIRAGDKPEPRA